MRRALLPVAAVTAAASVVAVGLWAGAESGHAQPLGADISAWGMHLTAAVGNIGVNPPGDRTPGMMAFSHAVQMSGDYSVDVAGDQITSGQTVAGFILGCGVNIVNGFPIGIQPNEGLSLGISPSFTPPSGTTPPSASLGPSVAGLLGLTEILAATLAPGQVTAATTATVNLDDKTQFPYHITFNNAALNVSQCVSSVSAVPFVTVTVGNAQGTVQTTAYGDQFVF
ncbi:MspA family porin [Nocardia sp. alder85J]|uniref:MspA family porin n=1 Tax=Nocardia sp. alder85J TaxID=2862949 RepID=UPI001CD6D5C2|nr:MspA family porin [Nocardia sp. alder85J]MCX4096164.1 MspA family porin [Nocardia sp. alder85J]